VVAFCFFGARGQQAGRRYASGLAVRSALRAPLRFALGLACGHPLRSAGPRGGFALGKAGED